MHAAFIDSKVRAVLPLMVRLSAGEGGATMRLHVRAAPRATRSRTRSRRALAATIPMGEGPLTQVLDNRPLKTQTMDTRGGGGWRMEVWPRGRPTAYCAFCSRPLRTLARTRSGPWLWLGRVVVSGSGEHGLPPPASRLLHPTHADAAGVQDNVLVGAREGPIRTYRYCIGLGPP